MSIIDNRVVRMVFDNAQFKKGAKDSEDALAKLDKSMADAGKNQGLNNIDSGMQRVQATATKMSVVVTTALATITNKAVNAATSFVKSFTMDPIRDGFMEYESLLTKQNVIQNATGASAKTVKKILNELNQYSDETIYSFGDMTDSITKFVNAGVPLDKSVESIKGIANMAAFAGANSEEAGRGMYAFSQAMAAGYMGLQDWKQVENANMGTVKFKETLIKTAGELGVLKKSGKGYVTSTGVAVNATSKWKDSLQEQWMSTEVMNKALAKYSDKTTKFGRKAYAAAQDVRTFSMFMDTLKESVGSGWASVFGNLIGGLKPATKMWTDLANAIGRVVFVFFEVIAAAAKTWRKLGGATSILNGIKNIMSPIVALFKLFSTILGNLFPSAGKKDLGVKLAGLSKGFERLTMPLRWLANALTFITPGVGKFAAVIGGLGQKLGGAISGSIKKLVDWIKALWDAINLRSPDATPIVKFFTSIADAGKKFYGAMKQVPELVKGIWSILSKGDFAGAFAGFEEDSKFVDFLFKVRDKIIEIKTQIKTMFAGFKLPSLPKLSMPNLPKINMPNIKMPTFGGMTAPSVDTSGLSASGDAVAKDANNLKETLGAIWAKIEEVVGKGVSGIGKLLGKIEFKDVLAGFNLGVWATLGISISKMMNAMASGMKGATDALGGVGKALKSFQTQAKAGLIKQIGIAVAILAGALFLLAQLNIGQLTMGLTGLAGVMGLMTGMLMALNKMGEGLVKSGGLQNLSSLAVVMIALAASILIMAVALKVMNGVGIGQVVAAVVVLGAVLGAVAILGKIAEKSTASITQAAASMVVIGAALIVLAIGLTAFKLVDWDSMGKAGAAIGGLTIALTALGQIKYDTLVKAGAAILIMSYALGVLGTSLLIFKMVDTDSMLKAGAALIVVAAALTGMSFLNPVGLIAAGAAMIMLSIAMGQLAVAGIMMAAVSWESLGKIGAVLIGLVVAIALLLGVMQYMALGVIMLGVFAVALMMLGVAALTFATAMTLMIAMGGAAATALAVFATAAAVAIAVFLQTLALQAPIIKESLLTMLQVLIDTIVEAVPIIVDGIKRLWQNITGELSGKDNIKMFAASAAAAITSFLNGLKSKAKDLAKAAVGLIAALLDGIADQADELVVAAVGIIVALIQGWTQSIGDVVAAAGDLIVAFIDGISDNIGKIVDAGANLIVEFLDGLAENLTLINASVLNLILEFIAGIDNNLQQIIDAGGDLIINFLEGIASKSLEIADAAFNTVITFINELSKSIDKNAPLLTEATKKLGKSIVDGAINGVKSMGGDALNAIKDLANNMIQKAKDMFKIFSPSRVFRDIGKFLVTGLTNGIANNAASAINAVASMVKGQIAIAEEYISKYVQRLEQQAIEARAKASGLESAAEKNEAAAKKTLATKNKAADELDKKAQEKLDKAKKKSTSKAEKKKLEEEAKALQNQAKDLRKRAKKEFDKDIREDEKAISKAEKAAAEKTAKAEKAADKANRQAEFKQADSLTKAQMKSEDAQTLIDEAREKQEQSGSKVTQARTLEAEAKQRQKALDKELKKNGHLYTKAQKKKMQDDIDSLNASAKKLRASAKIDAKDANDLLAQSKKAAVEALAWQKKAGDEAAKDMKDGYKSDADQAAKELEFEKKTNAEKAAIRKAESEEAQKQADADMAFAQQLAYTDVEAANALADFARENASRARDLLAESLEFDRQALEDAEKAAKGEGPDGTVPPRVIDMVASQSAAQAFEAYSNRYKESNAAAASTPTVQFQQYNTSPEALSATEIYRQTGNILSYRVGSLISP